MDKMIGKDYHCGRGFYLSRLFDIDIRGCPLPSFLSEAKDWQSDHFDLLYSATLGAYSFAMLRGASLPVLYGWITIRRRDESAGDTRSLLWDGLHLLDPRRDRILLLPCLEGGP